MVTNFAFPHSSLCWSPCLNLNHWNWPSNSTFTDRLRNAQVSQYVKLIMQDHAGSIIMGTISLTILWQMYNIYIYLFYYIFVDYTQTYIYYIYIYLCVCIDTCIVSVFGIWFPVGCASSWRGHRGRRRAATLRRRRAAARLQRWWRSAQLRRRLVAKGRILRWRGPGRAAEMAKNHQKPIDSISGKIVNSLSASV